MIEISLDEIIRDSDLADLIWKYIDRMNDVCESDPADKILREFAAEVNEIIGRRA